MPRNYRGVRNNLEVEDKKESLNKTSSDTEYSFDGHCKNPTYRCCHFNCARNSFKTGFKTYRFKRK